MSRFRLWRLSVRRFISIAGETGARPAWAGIRSQRIGSD
jgi:hypothetical protein